MSVEPHSNGHSLRAPGPRNTPPGPASGPEQPTDYAGTGGFTAPPAAFAAGRPTGFTPVPEPATIPGQRYRREPTRFGPPPAGFAGQPVPGFPGPPGTYRPAQYPFGVDPGTALGLGERPNTLAILSLVFAFCSPLAGLVLGIIARKQIAESGERGDGLAIAGIIVGALCTLGTAVWTVSMIIAWVKLGQLLAAPPPAP
jgi:hypothetical protein